MECERSVRGKHVPRCARDDRFEVARARTSVGHLDLLGHGAAYFQGHRRYTFAGHVGDESDGAGAVLERYAETRRASFILAPFERHERAALRLKHLLWGGLGSAGIKPIRGGNKHDSSD